MVRKARSLGGWWKSVIIGTATSPRKLTQAFLATWIGSAAIFLVLEAFTGAPGGYSVIDCLYWSMTTMSTTGYGDILPTSDISKIFVMAKMAWSFIFVGPVLIATVIELVKPDVHKDTDAEQKWRKDALEKIAEASHVSLNPYPTDS